MLVSELMLQQTQVRRVLAAYEAFLDRVPDAGGVRRGAARRRVAAWAGLGYNRRAVNLHARACVVMRSAGRLPDALDALLALPGIGPYTARAVLAFAFEAEVAVVDTNIARVLARSAAARSPPRRCRRPPMRHLTAVARGRGTRR